MGEYADSHIDELYDRHLELREEHPFASKAELPLEGIPYVDIKCDTEKAILIKLNIQIAPFNVKKYDVGYIWFPKSQVKINEKNKTILICSWILQKKLDEESQKIAERITRKE